MLGSSSSLLYYMTHKHVNSYALNVKYLVCFVKDVSEPF